jgi:hypothetical protein
MAESTEHAHCGPCAGCDGSWAERVWRSVLTIRDPLEGEGGGEEEDAESPSRCGTRKSAMQLEASRCSAVYDPPTART